MILPRARSTATHPGLCRVGSSQTWGRVCNGRASAAAGTEFAVVRAGLNYKFGLY